MRKIIHFILKLLLWGISGNLNTIYGNLRIEEALLTETISIGATKEEIKSIIGDHPSLFVFIDYLLKMEFINFGIFLPIKVIFAEVIGQ